MRSWMLVPLLIAPTLADDALEAEFIVALNGHLTAGKAEQTVTFNAPEPTERLSAL
jgi:hypothetical protein